MSLLLLALVAIWLLALVILAAQIIAASLEADESISLPWEVTKKCRLCRGRGNYPGFDHYNPERVQ